MFYSGTPNNKPINFMSITTITASGEANHNPLMLYCVKSTRGYATAINRENVKPKKNPPTIAPFNPPVALPNTPAAPPIKNSPITEGKTATGKKLDINVTINPPIKAARKPMVTATGA